MHNKNSEVCRGVFLTAGIPVDKEITDVQPDQVWKETNQLTSPPISGHHTLMNLVPSAWKA